MLFHHGRLVWGFLNKYQIELVAKRLMFDSVASLAGKRRTWIVLPWINRFVIFADEKFFLFKPITVLISMNYDQVQSPGELIQTPSYEVQSRCVEGIVKRVTFPTRLLNNLWFASNFEIHVWQCFSCSWAALTNQVTKSSMMITAVKYHHIYFLRR